MPDRVPRQPGARHNNPNDLAVIWINRHDHDLGRDNSPENRVKYGKLAAEWYASGRVEPSGVAGQGAPTLPRPATISTRRDGRRLSGASGGLVVVA